MNDFHIHTVFSDGKNTIEEMINIAEEIGLQMIAFTDHVWQDSKWFKEYETLIRNENKKRKIKILVGFEAKALSVKGEIDASAYMCRNADIRIGAIHRIPKGSQVKEYFTREEIKTNKNKAYDNWLMTTENLIKNKNVDIIAHPCMVLTKYNIFPKQKDILKLLTLVKKFNKKFELSGRYKSSNLPILKSLAANPHFLSFTVYASDAHSILELKEAHSSQ